MSNTKVYLAPMEGLTDYMFRNAFDEFFGHGKIDKYFMPFISPNQTEKFLAKEMRDIDRNNNLINSIPQIMTNNSEDFIWTAHMLFDNFGYNEINLNAGCPSGTVVSKSKGSGMLADTDRLERILYEIMSDNYIQDNNIKVSVKTRIGIESPDEWYNILEVYNKFSLEELIIHPRVRTDYYRGDVNKEAFKLAIKESRNPVCYNGDIFTRNDYIAFLKDYAYTDENSKSPLPHCIMLGRGLVADPGLINVLISDNPYEYARNLKEDKDNMRKLHNYVYEERLKIMSGDKHAIHRMKEMWCYMEYAFGDCKKEAKAIKKAQKMSDYKDAVNVFFTNCHLSEPAHILFSKKF